LREQVNYFVRCRQMADVKVGESLQRVKMSYLLDRYDMDAEIDWESVLSGGEQQRLVLCAALACPNIGCIVLDETTASCDVPAERDIYTMLLSSGKQFITVSHRPELMTFHHLILNIDSNSQSYTITQLALLPSAMTSAVNIPVATNTDTVVFHTDTSASTPPI
jgi:putative ATP-binding cassette transporter